MRLFLYLHFSLFFFLGKTTAQDQHLHPCGTQDGKVEWLKNYQQATSLFPQNDDTLFVPMTIHLVGTDEGNGYFTLSQVLDAMCTLNGDFADSKIRFYMAGLNYIPNTVYYDHTFGQGAEMMEIYRVPGTINSYIVNSPAGNCGYSSYNLGVALAKGCTGANDHTWAHEIGHFLSLPHPFWGWEGHEHSYTDPAPLQWDDALVERLDGVDCHLAGDGFCDTAPDYLNYRWSCNADNFSNQIQTDPNGETFFSDGSLFMSYASDACMGRFSEEQTAAMRANLLDEKADHLQAGLPELPVEVSNASLVLPAEGAFVENYQFVEFAWEPFANATGYFLEITIFENFNTVLFRFETTATNFTVPSLPKNREIFWRVRPYNFTYTCKEYSAVSTFETGDLVSSVRSLEQVTDLQVQPNPLPRGRALSVRLVSTEALPLEASLLDLTGRQVLVSRQALRSGDNQFQLMTDHLAPGLYFLRLRTEQGLLSRRVVVK